MYAPRIAADTHARTVEVDVEGRHDVLVGGQRHAVVALRVRQGVWRIRQEEKGTQRQAACAGLSFGSTDVDEGRCGCPARACGGSQEEKGRRSRSEAGRVCSRFESRQW